MAYDGIDVEERRRGPTSWLKEVGLGPKKPAHSPCSFPAGERQRVGIVALWSNKPASSRRRADRDLDSKSFRRDSLILQAPARSGMTIILVTHDPAIGAAAERVIRLKTACWQ